jgi:hypothetical protein
VLMTDCVSVDDGVDMLVIVFVMLMCCYCTHAMVR